MLKTIYKCHPILINENSRLTKPKGRIETIRQSSQTIKSKKKLDKIKICPISILVTGSKHKHQVLMIKNEKTIDKKKLKS